jgi:hypothetical protein
MPTVGSGVLEHFAIDLVVVDLPFVPVTPITIILYPGKPKKTLPVRASKK